MRVAHWRATTSPARLVLHLKRRTLLRPALPAIVEPGRRNVGMPEPLLHLGDVGVVRERGRDGKGAFTSFRAVR